MTMGKGGVGQDERGRRRSVALAERGYRVHLTTTDPAAHVKEALGAAVPANLRVSRIDPEAETRAYVEEALRAARASLETPGCALLEEDSCGRHAPRRWPCSAPSRASSTRASGVSS